MKPRTTDLKKFLYEDFLPPNPQTTEDNQHRKSKSAKVKIRPRIYDPGYGYPATGDKAVYQFQVHWAGYLLSEVYLEIIGGGGKLPFLTLLRNLPALLKVMATASSRIRVAAARFLEEPHIDPDGWHPGCAHRRLGLLYKAKKQRTLAVQHLTEARRHLSQFGETPQLARVDAALVRLGVGPP